jgi:hypothetical protein
MAKGKRKEVEILISIYPSSKNIAIGKKCICR